MADHIVAVRSIAAGNVYGRDAAQIAVRLEHRGCPMGDPTYADAGRRLVADNRSIYYVEIPSSGTVYVRAMGEQEAAEAFDVAGYDLDGLAMRRGRRDNPQLGTWDDVTPRMGDWFCQTARPERAFRVRAFTLEAAWRKARAAAKVDLVMTVEPLADAKRRYEQQQAKGE